MSERGIPMGFLPVPTKRASRFIRISLISLAAAAVLLALYLHQPPVPHTSGVFPQEAYVWQRSWSDPVREGIRLGAPSLSGLVALAAEVSWSGGLSTVRVRLDYDALRESGLPVGLALRIGPFGGAKKDFESRAAFLAELAASLVAEAKAAGVLAKEFQIDFDCPESKLDYFRTWVRAIKKSCAPVPVTFTALPSWLDCRAFGRLARDADGFVIQVHSLERPRGPDAPMQLCDPAASRKWIEQAARIGEPFLVALPTYGYVVAFDKEGKFISLSAEGPTVAWRKNVRLRTVRADPAAMAALVRDLTESRPANMVGVIWYRLPISEDQQNWRWPTLAAVMAGRTPVSDLRAETKISAPGLVDVTLVNAGEADAPLAVSVRARWSHGRLLAHDALGGFASERLSPDELRFRWSGAERVPLRIGPGERRPIGWLRFDTETEVEVDVALLEE